MDDQPLDSLVTCFQTKKMMFFEDDEIYNQ